MIFSSVSQGGVGRVIAGEEGSSRQCFDVIVVLCVLPRYVPVATCNRA